MAQEPDSSAETFAVSGETRRDRTDRFTPGTMLAGRYRLVAPLGHGGMGEVYRADDTRLGQPVALKFLSLALAVDASRLDRLRQEVSIGRQISHPNVCRLYDIAEANGHHFLVMEYVDGEDLASLLRRIGRLPADKALEIARGLCAGLAAAHDKGVIHRDLKPANVMIDGRGHARIADFGLAEPLGAGHTKALAGTIGYMAPEQLSGEGATVRSDIFALGLVLYEMFTGRRAFDAKSIEEFRALYADSKPPSLSGSGGDVDPAVERVILRCLGRDPEQRPASAQAVQAALPGGDPLQAAIAMGETPSPEMVAADSRVGDLRAPVAWACLAAGLIGLASITILSGRVRLYEQVPLPKSPDAMADRARDVLARLGYGETGADNVYDFFTDFAFLNYVAARDALPAQLETLRSARPGPILFYYRESPRPLVSTRWVPSPPWEGPAFVGRVEQNEPPLNVPNMTRVVLDPLGRLVRFDAVPPFFEPEPGPGPEPDWSIAIAEAGFNVARLQPSASQWSLSVDSDRRAAWDGAIEGQPDVRFHVEAAGYRGRLVSFRMRGPWVEPPGAVAADPMTQLIVTVMIVFSLATLFLAGLWARRNLQRGRGDRKGAARLAVFTFASLSLANLFPAAHTTLAITELNLLMQIAGQGLFGAMVIWIEYIALEPAVRRRWPHTLISWNRLLAGRWRDPLLARDVLVGLLAGVAVALILPLDLASALMGRPLKINGDIGTLNEWQDVAYLFFVAAPTAVIYSVGFQFLLWFFQALLRRAWLARLMVLLFFLGAVAASGDDTLTASVKGAILAVIILVSLIRFGLLSTAVLIFSFSVLGNASLTLDGSAWYAGRSFFVLALFAALMVAAFFASLGGKPPFGRALIED